MASQLARTIVRSLLTACFVLALAPVANAQWWRVQDSEATGSADVSYWYEIWVMEDMENERIVDMTKFDYNGQSGPPMYVHQWSFSKLVFIIGSPEQVFARSITLKTSRRGRI